MKFKKKIGKELLFDVALFMLEIMLISLLYNYNILLLGATFIIILIANRFWYKPYELYFLIAGAVVGPVAEIISIYFGAWAYTNPTILGIPIWLPLAWGLATMLIKRIAEIFVKIEIR